MAPFDLDNCAKSTLSKQIKHLIEEVSNLTMYRKAISVIGIDTDKMPISKLNR